MFIEQSIEGRQQTSNDLSTDIDIGFVFLLLGIYRLVFSWLVLSHFCIRMRRLKRYKLKIKHKVKVFYFQVEQVLSYNCDSDLLLQNNRNNYYY